MTLCECGCGGNPPIAKMTNRKYGHVQGKPVRFILGHQMRRSLDERFWGKVVRSDGCWEWVGARATTGYGMLYFREERTTKRWHKLAHRVSWELANGPIPDGMLVCHRCDNPPCVNPAHLFLGSDADNSADKWAKGRGWNPQAEARKAQTHCVRGHEFTPENTYWHPAGRSRMPMRHCRECRSSYRRRRKETLRLAS